MNLIWLSFLTDYLTRLYLAQNRAKWARKNLLDLASVALPFLRPLRLIRLITAFLMVAGMALIGVITASLASWITERASNDNQNVEDTTHTKLAELEALILEMREEMRVSATQTGERQ